MEVKEFDLIVDKLEALKQFHGNFGVFLIIVIAIIGLLLWRYLTISVKRIVKDTSEKSLKEFQSNLDKELVKFTSKHQNQIDAIHEVYQAFQRLIGMINFVMKGEKFTQRMDTIEEIQYLTQYRLDFKRKYSQNKLLFPEILCDEIKSLIPKIDIFIETYYKGVAPFFQSSSKNEEGVVTLGIWQEDDFAILEELEKTSRNIETEFRKIYGTYE